MTGSPGPRPQPSAGPSPHPGSDLRRVGDAGHPGSNSRRGPRGDAGDEPSRRDLVLAMVREAPAPLSVADIAERLDVHPNTVRFHLDALLASGAVERTAGERAGPGRPPVVYVPRPGMDRGGPRNYLLLAEILAGHLAATAADPAQAAIDAGRTWGAFLAQSPPPVQEVTETQAVGRLVELLDGLGFAPEPQPAERPTRIGLRHCPFLELTDTRARVVCPIHLGLMQGAMKAMGAPLTATHLEPFARPDLCLAHLGPATDRPAPSGAANPQHPDEGRT
ncbi:helix-turn-helix domain-containing protein [Sphaerisporangium sp. NBC_01403]|uniref:helix-turn-helix transcriptional regulator n=1 Tax=Sphaerisporangium sp. NBC_01403 TaxID=2903599 RepID=UPI00324E15C9